MERTSELNAAAKQYALAYSAHKTEKDLRRALELYKVVLSSHPISREAGYARTQIQNIVDLVVPRAELLSLQLELAFACLGREVPVDGDANGESPLV